MLRMSPNARVLRARSKTMRDEESHGWREESSVKTVESEQKELMTSVLYWEIQVNSLGTVPTSY